MKKLVYLLMPVMPGFNAWAVQGFVEYVEKCDDATNKPEVIPHDGLKKLVDGFDCPAGDTVFVPYDGVSMLIRELNMRSLRTSVQPLDRGGILVCGELTKLGWDKVAETIGYDLTTPAPVSKSE